MNGLLILLRATRLILEVTSMGMTSLFVGQVGPESQ